jgi:putative cardiolipin synthase
MEMPCDGRLQVGYRAGSIRKRNIAMTEHDSTPPLTGRLGLIALLLLLGACAGLPKLDSRTASTALADTAQTRLGKAVHAEGAAHPDKSGIHPLPIPQEAFAARVLLARAAERSLDVQYYIWHGERPLAVAEPWTRERGVRVRCC